MRRIATLQNQGGGRFPQTCCYVGSNSILLGREANRMTRFIVAALVLLLSLAPAYARPSYSTHRSRSYSVSHRRRHSSATSRNRHRSRSEARYRSYSRSYSSFGRSRHGRIHRSAKARYDFMRDTGYSHGRKGYVVDHVVPLACGGADNPSNMQWQTKADAKAKDKWERKGCK